MDRLLTLTRFDLEGNAIGDVYVRLLSITTFEDYEPSPIFTVISIMGGKKFIVIKEAILNAFTEAGLYSAPTPPGE